MSSIVICDKCGLTSKQINKFNHIRVYSLTSVNTHDGKCKDFMDLCKECYKKIFNNEEDKNNGN